MAPFWRGVPGNASSLHAGGRRAKEAIDEARTHVAALLGVREPSRIFFTSGGTESDVWALRGVFESDLADAERDHLLVSAVEHPAVLETARRLARRGVRLTLAPVDRLGRLGDLAVDTRTRLVSIMAANNETGNLHDLPSIAVTTRNHGAIFHVDAVQACGKVPLELDAWGVDLASVSGHKLGGPQGVGALYLREGVSLAPLLTGGGQEGGQRSGTHNTAGIVGLGEAARLARAELSEVSARMAALRDAFEEGVRSRVPWVRRLGDRERRLPNTASLSFPGIKGEALLMAMDAEEICVSTGSACSSGSGKPSHVLVAMGLSQSQLDGALRVSLGTGTTRDEVDVAAGVLADIALRLAALSPDRPSEDADV